MYDPSLVPWGEVGYAVYKRTYSRTLENGKTEEWEDTVDRVIDACRDQLNVGFTQFEEGELKKIMMELKGTVAGRFLWQLGTKTVRSGRRSYSSVHLGVRDADARLWSRVQHPA
jgi:hypothetical protein